MHLDGWYETLVGENRIAIFIISRGMKNEGTFFFLLYSEYWSEGIQNEIFRRVLIPALRSILLLRLDSNVQILKLR